MKIEGQIFIAFLYCAYPYCNYPDCPRISWIIFIGGKGSFQYFLMSLFHVVFRVWERSGAGILLRSYPVPANIYLLRFNKINFRKRCEICSKLTIKTPERRHWRRSGVSIVNFEHIPHLFLLFLTLNFNKQLFTGMVFFCWTRTPAYFPLWEFYYL